jgi:hypothetical protein
MPFTYKTLGQTAPSTTDNVDIRIFQRINGATAGTANALAYDVDIAGNALVSIELKLTLDAADVITIRSATANALTFTVNGSEIA